MITKIWAIIKIGWGILKAVTNKKQPTELGKLIIKTKKDIEGFKNDLQENKEQQESSISSDSITILEQQRVSIESQITTAKSKLGEAVLDSGWDGSTN